MNIGIIGSTGRLANEIIELLRNQDSHKLTAAITRKGNQNIGQKIKCNSEVVEITSDFSQCETCDVLIDVTRRDAFINQNLEIYKKLKKPLILATTGFTEEDEKKNT